MNAETPCCTPETRVTPSSPFIMHRSTVLVLLLLLALSTTTACPVVVPPMRAAGDSSSGDHVVPPTAWIDQVSVWLRSRDDHANRGNWASQHAIPTVQAGQLVGVRLLSQAASTGYSWELVNQTHDAVVQVTVKTCQTATSTSDLWKATLPIQARTWPPTAHPRPPVAPRPTTPPGSRHALPPGAPGVPMPEIWVLALHTDKRPYNGTVTLRFENRRPWEPHNETAAAQHEWVVRFVVV